MPRICRRQQQIQLSIKITTNTNKIIGQITANQSKMKLDKLQHFTEPSLLGQQYFSSDESNIGLGQE